jgi:hypothetical protein
MPPGLRNPELDDRAASRRAGASSGDRTDRDDEEQSMYLHDDALCTFRAA